MRLCRWQANRVLIRRLAATPATVMLLWSSPLAAQDFAADPFGVSDGVDVRALLLLGVLIGVVAFAVVVTIGAITAVRRARQAAARAEAIATRVESDLDFLQTILMSEPQLLAHWGDAGEPSVVVATLPAKLGVPTTGAELMRLSSWLDRDSARELQERLDALQRHGTPFNVMLKTAAGGHIEADGRAAGGGTILRLRDLAGRRMELAQVLDQHKRLNYDIQAMRTLLDALPSPAWLRNGRGRIEWVNRAYVKAVEAASADAVRTHQIELLESRDLAQSAHDLRRGGSFQRRVHTLVAGERHAYDAIILPVGEGSVGIAIDAAAIESAESTLNRHIEAHVRTLDRMTTAVAIFSPEQKLTYFNQAFVNLWQLDRAWLAGSPRDGEILDRLRESRLLPEEADYRAWKARQLSAYAGLTPHEDWWHLPDGRTIHVVADQSPDGGVTYLYEDVTERLQLESRYNALIQVQKETLDHLREGVAVFASNGRLKLFNPAFATIWKLNHTELAGEPHIDDVIAQCRVLLDEDAAWDEVKSAVTGIADRRRPIEGSLNRADGSVIVYAGIPLPDGATLLTYVDITDSKRAERALIERNEALEAADRLKSAFISHVSYELRAPLTSIIGFSELLADPHTGPLTDKQREYVGDIRSASASLLAIINDILDLATIDAGILELNLAPVRVREVIEAAVQGVRDRLQRADLHLEIRVQQDVDEFVADAKRVTQVLFNLLSNAIAFSEPGGVIRLTCRREGDMTTFAVQDRGAGIPHDYQAAVFDRFESRAQGSRQGGAGLGLSIVKSLVELHGGDVSLESAQGQGTRVVVRFPSRQRAGYGGDDARSAQSGYFPAA